MVPPVTAAASGYSVGLRTWNYTKLTGKQTLTITDKKGNSWAQQVTVQANMTLTIGKPLYKTTLWFNDLAILSTISGVTLSVTQAGSALNQNNPAQIVNLVADQEILRDSNGIGKLVLYLPENPGTTNITVSAPGLNAGMAVTKEKQSITTNSNNIVMLGSGFFTGTMNLSDGNIGFSKDSSGKLQITYRPYSGAEAYTETGLPWEREYYIVQQGGSTSNQISVSNTGDSTAHITLDGVRISSSGQNCIDLQNAKARLTPVNGNTLSGSGGSAALHVPPNASVEIAGNGMLTVSTAGKGAGIGGNNGEAGGNITISGGTVEASTTALSTPGAAIGGGNNAACGTLTIAGGTVIANSKYSAAAIGSGSSCTSGKGQINITGGTVIATATDVSIGNTNRPIACKITGGSVYAGANSNAKFTTDGTTAAQETKLRLQNADNGYAANALVTAAPVSGYGMKDMYTDGNGYLYLWLPANTAVTSITTENGTYTGSTTSGTAADFALSASGTYGQALNALTPGGGTVKAGNGNTVTGTWGASITHTTAGKGTLTYYLKETATGLVAQKTFAYQLDKTAPNIGTITYNVKSGLLDWLFHNNKITVTVPVTDSASGADYISYVLTNSGIAAEAVTVNVANGTAVFDLSKTFKGSIAITAYDKAGNAGAVSTAEKISVEDTKPTLTASASSGTQTEFGTDWYAAAQTIYITAQDGGSGVKSVSYTVDGGAAQNLFTAASTDGNLTTEKALTISAREGMHTYVITATDNALNTAQPVTVTPSNSAAAYKATVTGVKKGISMVGIAVSSKPVSGVMVKYAPPSGGDSNNAAGEMNSIADTITAIVGDPENMTNTEKAVVNAAATELAKLTPDAKKALSPTTIENLDSLYEKSMNISASPAVTADDNVSNPISAGNVAVKGMALASGATSAATVKVEMKQRNPTQTASGKKSELEFEMKLTVGGTEKELQAPLLISLPLPDGINTDGMIIKHTKSSGGSEEITLADTLSSGHYTLSGNTATMWVNSFSTFTFMTVDSNSGGGSGGSGDNGGGGSSANYYTITATAGAGGSISTGKSVSVREGDSAGFTMTPDKGYIIADVKVNGKSVGAVKHYVFTNVRSPQTIEVTFKTSGGHVNPQTGVAFEDVAEKDWFYEFVYNAVEKGWFAGTSEKTFTPNSATTRGMIATVLHRMENEPTATAASIFEDVASGAYYAGAVNWAQENGIVGGYGSGKFGPEDNITREQMVSILYRYAQFKGCDVTKITALDSFSDAGSLSNYAVAPMQWAVANGLISGKSGGILDPKGSATRAQVAAILTRFDALFSEDNRIK